MCLCQIFHLFVIFYEGVVLNVGQKRFTTLCSSYSGEQKLFSL